MSDPAYRYGFLKGLSWGLGAVAATWTLLLLLDKSLQFAIERPLFNRPHTMALLVLATTMVLFRMLIKKGDFQIGKGFFLAIFISSIAYLFYHKYTVIQ
jgi:hypothetical protein